MQRPSVSIRALAAAALLLAGLPAGAQDKDALIRENIRLHHIVDSLTEVVSRMGRPQATVSSMDEVDIYGNSPVADAGTFISFTDRWSTLSGVDNDTVTVNVTPLFDIDTVLFIPYDDCVRKYIGLYSQSRRLAMRSVLQRYDRYKDMFSEVFRRNGIPEEFTLLSVVESGVNSNAVSPAGAVGMWQFMPDAARAHGMTVNALMDERRDVAKSTAGAAKYLRGAYRTFGSWSLAIMSYNCGPGRIQKVIKQCGDDLTYENIYKHLPQETREYLPALVAAMYINANRDLLY